MTFCNKPDLIEPLGIKDTNWLDESFLKSVNTTAAEAVEIALNNIVNQFRISGFSCGKMVVFVAPINNSHKRDSFIAVESDSEGFIFIFNVVDAIKEAIDADLDPRYKTATRQELLTLAARITEQADRLI